MIQLNEQSDARLNALEHQLAETVAEQERLQQKYDMLFAQVFSEFDQALGEGVPASFVCDDGFKLARLVPNMQPVIDHKKVETVVSAWGTVKQADAAWNRITDVVRVVNQDKLAKEIRRNPSLGAALNDVGAISVPTRKPSRIRKEATKQERMLAQHAKREEAAG